MGMFTEIKYDSPTEERDLVNRTWAMRQDFDTRTYNNKIATNNFCGVTIVVASLKFEEVGPSMSQIHGEPAFLAKMINKLLDNYGDLPEELQKIIDKAQYKTKRINHQTPNGNTDQDKNLWEELQKFKQLLNTQGVSVTIFTEREPCNNSGGPQNGCDVNLLKLLGNGMSINNQHKIIYAFNNHTVPSWAFAARIIKIEVMPFSVEIL